MEGVSVDGVEEIEDDSLVKRMRMDRMPMLRIARRGVLYMCTVWGNTVPPPPPWVMHQPDSNSEFRHLT
jgi:hypothetical protein